MKALDKIIGTVNILLFAGLIALVIGFTGAIIGGLGTTLGLLFLLLPMLVIIWGFVNSLKYIQKNETRFADYTLLEKILIVIPILNFSFIALVTMGSLIYLL